MSDGPSRAEYTSFVERVYHTMETGFEQINERLDTINGRTGKGEIADAEIRARVVSLEKEVFREKRSGLDRRHEEGETAVTRREGAIAAASLTALVIALKVIEVLVSKVWALLPALTGIKG